MNLVKEAIGNLQFVIPPEILEATFLNKNYYVKNHVFSLDYAIKEKILVGRVFKDCNMVGGIQTIISMQGLPYEVIDRVNMIVRVPMEKTQGRLITTVLNISIADYFAVGMGVPMQSNRGALLGATDKVVDALLPIPNVSNTAVKLIDQNTILINGIPNVPNNCYLRCILENEAEFNNILPASYPDFFKLVELATKAYIYTNMRIKVARSAMVGGHDLGVFREEVDSYADANTLYREHLETRWVKVAFLNDPESRARHLKHVGALM